MMMMMGSLAAGNSALGKSVGVGVEVVAQALNEAVPLRRIHTVDEAGQAGDALLKASFVDWIGRHRRLGVDGLGDRSETHAGSRRESRSARVVWVWVFFRVA